MRSVVKLKRTEILESSGPIRLEVEASDFHMEDVATVVSETCPVEMEVSQAGSDSRVTGSVEIVVQETCDRCLTVFDRKLRGRFSVILTEDDSFYSGETDEVYLFPPTQAEFDFGPLITDAIRLERPMKQLCMEDCKGLCPHCGTNWNESDCDCRDDSVDERWAPLKALQQSGSEG